MSDSLLGHFVAIIGRVKSPSDSEPFGDDRVPCDFGPEPWGIVCSAWAHSSFASESPPVGSASAELIGNDIVATGELWVDRVRGADTAGLLQRLGAAAKFSVAYQVHDALPPTSEQRARGVRRVITAATLLELSPVLMPAEPATRLISLKADAAEVAAALGDLRTIARHKALAAQIRAREEASQWDEVRALARRLMARHAMVA